MGHRRSLEHLPSHPGPVHHRCFHCQLCEVVTRGGGELKGGVAAGQWGDAILLRGIRAATEAVMNGVWDQCWLSAAR